jgi:23S rRNA (adenine-N6)-dimethyltransferase
VCAARSAQWWGWHQLTPSWARRLVAESGARPGDLVLDVGAGTGALTAPLLAAGARVVAVELHPRRLDSLRERFDGERFDGGRIKIVRADASDLRLPRRPFRVVANPPFGITTALLRRLLAPGSRLTAADLVVPTDVAHRWSAGRAPGAGRWQRDYALHVGRRLPRNAFVPAAPMDCALLLVRRRRT